MVDILGFLGGSCIICAMLLRNIFTIKILMLVAAIIFLTYGIILHLLPIMVINSIMTASGIYELVRLSRKRKQAASTS